MRAWVSATAQRLAFLGADPLALLDAVDAVVSRDPDAALRAFLDACLDLLDEALPPGDASAAIMALSAMARAEIAGACDDRAILAREESLMDQPAPIPFAATVPGRVVWLAAMAARVPDQEGPAAVMLVNDLAAVGQDLPLRAFRKAAG
ncbi:hypothetical protein [Falsiroseomonas stagni]|uniref:Uncharacterized protein n=1 Tax=Falsiroseomonas stagni DSM 19981 TaxID=1123062 RepID=A0A1I4CDL3_9PROT|nr:hypothetical protein [Falsiroseomonas stagni]SFK78091.1 hypothetical protein SAMN02745775_10788 [Falsiroseomonas stagni DSM 19981]